MNIIPRQSFGIYRHLIACIILFICPIFIFGQNSIGELEKNLREQHGKEKLATLLELTEYYIDVGEDKKALRFARQAEILSSNIIREENSELTPEDFKLKPRTFINLGRAYQNRGFYLESKKAFNEGILSAQEMNSPGQVLEATSYLLEMDSLGIYLPKEKKPFLGKVFRDIGKAVDKGTNEFGVTASLKLAKIYTEDEEYEKALNQYGIARNLLVDLGKFEDVDSIDVYIEEIESEIERLVEEEYMSDEDLPEASTDNIDMIESPVIQSKPREIPKPPLSVPPQTPQQTAQRTTTAITQSSNPEEIRDAARSAESRRNYEESIDYYKQYIETQKALQDQQTNQQLALLEQANEIENRDREILLLKQNDQLLEAEILQKKVANRNLAIGAGLLGIVLLSLYFMYFNKQRDHKKLSVAYNKLETTQNQLQTAQSRIKNLLHQQVSGAVANELLSATGENPVARRFVCIMFLDIRDFTTYAEERGPEEIIEYQNKVFGFMIETVNKHHGIVNQILGDGFMATFGAPTSAGNDCDDAYRAAQEIISIVNEKSLSGEIPATKVGIGLHAGYVVTGNVGTADRKQYSITGNPVIIASRLEQLNKTFGSSIVISKDVYDQLPEEQRAPMEFNEVTVKGRSKPVEVAAI